jgi:hypothetical protein
MAIPKTEIKTLEDKISDSTDAEEIKGLRAKLRVLFKQRAQAAEGEMYSGKNNAAAMRETEAAKAKLSQVKKDAGSVRLPSDFPIAWESHIVEMIRRQAGNREYPDRATIVAFWEKHKDEIDVKPSEVPRKKLDKTIPGGVKRLYEQGPRGSGN